MATYAYLTLALQFSSFTAKTAPSTNCSTKTVQSLDHFASPPMTKAPLAPFLLKARISLAPTHFASHTARSMGTFLFRHWSSRVLPRMPCGIVLLSRRNEMAGFARSFSQNSLFVSVNVTRGGGLNVDGAVTCPLCRFWFKTPIKIVDKALSPVFCLRTGTIDNRALPESALGRSHIPLVIDSVDHESSRCFPVHGKKSACPENRPFPKKSPCTASCLLVCSKRGAAAGISTVYGLGRPSFFAGAAGGATSRMGRLTELCRGGRRFGIGIGGGGFSSSCCDALDNAGLFAPSVPSATGSIRDEKLEGD